MPPNAPRLAAPYAALRRTLRCADQDLVREFIYRNNEDDNIYYQCTIIDWAQLTPSQRQEFKEVCAFPPGWRLAANRLRPLLRLHRTLLLLTLPRHQQILARPAALALRPTQTG